MGAPKFAIAFLLQTELERLKYFISEVEKHISLRLDRDLDFFSSVEFSEFSPIEELFHLYEESVNKTLTYGRFFFEKNILCFSGLEDKILDEFSDEEIYAEEVELLGKEMTEKIQKTRDEAFAIINEFYADRNNFGLDVQ